MKASKPTAADSIVGSRRPEDNRCWLCAAPGIPERTLRADVHVSGHLCLRCWGLQPRGRNSWARAASALYVALALPRAWHDTGYRSGWLETTAKRYGVTAWHDVPRATEPPDEPFGWIAPDVLEAAAADLARQEEAFEQARIPPSDRATGKAGHR
ncbi:hypothetical protein ACIRP7_13910 [Streptomyces sp. NPDC102270]|uniref:hypothetical protein n=1 Tax=Streptomyces sp. NPDC102270 TaxID=3366150 RepID=UPI00382FEFE6